MTEKEPQSAYRTKLDQVKNIAEKLKNSSTTIDEAIVLLEDATRLFREIIENIDSELPLESGMKAEGNDEVSDSR